MITTPQNPRDLRKPNRLPMRTDRHGNSLQPHEMRTFSIVAPIQTHWQPATCEQVQCKHFVQGWVSTIDERIALGQKQAHYIRTESGRAFTESRDELGMTVFRFKPGQKCFRGQHYARDEDVQELLVISRGDWRRTVTPPQVVGADEWINRFGDNQQWLAKRLDGGLQLSTDQGGQ